MGNLQRSERLKRKMAPEAGLAMDPDATTTFARFLNDTSPADSYRLLLVSMFSPIHQQGSRSDFDM
jgi:hypothetical protein